MNPYSLQKCRLICTKIDRYSSFNPITSNWQEAPETKDNGWRTVVLFGVDCERSEAKGAPSTVIWKKNNHLKSLKMVVEKFFKDRNSSFFTLNSILTWTGPARPGPNALWRLISLWISKLGYWNFYKALNNSLKFSYQFLRQLPGKF